MANARKAAVKLLTKLDENSAYSNILLDKELDRYKLDERDKHFATALFYGCIERRLTLDRIIDSRLVRRADKLSLEVRNILRTGIYQLLYMDSVPDHTAVDESVKLVDTRRNPALPGFVNGLMRGFVRDGKPLPEGKNEAEKLMYEYSCPIWLVQKWTDEYGAKTAKDMLIILSGNLFFCIFRIMLIAASRIRIPTAIRIPRKACAIHVISRKLSRNMETRNMMQKDGRTIPAVAAAAPQSP